jgi:hypothetical protein
MQCPRCNEAVLITTTVVIKHHPDERWDVETPFEFESDDSVECSSCDWAGTYKGLSGSAGAPTKSNRGRKGRVSILKRATPYPWGRDDQGNLIGANGHAIYFVGADALLVERAPLMLERLVSVRDKAAVRGSSQDPGNRLRAIWGLADTLISDIERTYVSQTVHPVRRATGRAVRTTKLPSRATRTRTQ